MPITGDNWGVRFEEKIVFLPGTQNKVFRKKKFCNEFNHFAGTQITRA
jgi:hypothetical protein